MDEVSADMAARELLGEDEKDGRPQADIIVDLIRDSDAILFVDDQEEAYVAPNGDGTDVFLLDSRKFKRLMTQMFFESEKRAPSGEALRMAMLTLEAIAHSEGEVKLLSVRVAWDDDVLWYDLGSAAAKMDAQGYAVVESPPILFKRFAHQKAQVSPLEGGDFEKVIKFLPLRPDSDEAVLEKVWILACLSPDGPRPLMDTAGPQGSGKTTKSRVEKAILDPSSIETIRRLSDVKDLQQQLSHTWALFADNSSGISGEVSDMLAAAITGDAVMRRKLYTNQDEEIFRYRRVLAINGISHSAERPDLLDRTILILLNRIDNQARLDEAAFWHEFNIDLPAILGGAFEILSKAIALLPGVKIARLPRMADFSKWGYAIAEAAGYGGARFLAAYERNIERQHDEAIAASVLAQALVAFMQTRDSWSGKASVLKRELDSVARDELSIDPDNRRSGWPQDASRLSKEALKLSETLAATGLQISRGYQGHGRVIQLQKIDPAVGGVGHVGFSTDFTDGTDSTAILPDGRLALAQALNNSTDGTDGKVRGKIATTEQPRPLPDAQAAPVQNSEDDVSGAGEMEGTSVPPSPLVPGPDVNDEIKI